MITMTTNKETRNIIDHYHYWSHEAIIADLDAKRNNFSVICSNLYNDFNIATVIRNGNAFLANKIIVYGAKQYDRRGTVGTHNYTHFSYCKNIECLGKEIVSLRNQKGSVRIVGMDNISSAKPIESYNWPNDEHVIMVFGQEQVGIPQELLDICDDLVYITQYGSVRSLNVGCASGVAMYDYCRKVVA